jgi:TolB protein
MTGRVPVNTDTPAGAMHYHPNLSPDGKWLLFGSKRDGVRQLYVMRRATRRNGASRT